MGCKDCKCENCNCGGNSCIPYDNIDKLMPEVYKSWVCYGDIVRWVYCYMGNNNFTIYTPHVIKDGVKHYLGVNCDNKDFRFIKYRLRDLLSDRNDYAKIEFTDLTLFVINFMKTRGYASLLDDIVSIVKTGNSENIRCGYAKYLMQIYEAYRIEKTIKDNADNPHHASANIYDIINDIVKDRNDYDKLNLVEIKEFVDEYINKNKGSCNNSINFGEVVQQYFKQKAETERYDKRWNTCWFDMAKPKTGIPLATKEEVLCVCTIKDAGQLVVQSNTREDIDRNALGLVLVTFEQIPGKGEFQLTTRRRFITVDRFKKGNFGNKPIYLKFSHAFELMKAGFRCSPLLHQEYEYCFGIKEVGYKMIQSGELPSEYIQNTVILQFLSQKAVGISSPIPPTIDNFTMGMMLDEWKIV